MKTSSRPREIGGSFAARRGHAPQLSITDTNHHVTEAIGDMYGDDDYSTKRDSRPLSFIASPPHDSAEAHSSHFDTNIQHKRPSASINGNSGKKAHTSPAMMQSPRSASMDKTPLSPALSLRERNASDTANAQFPLNDIDYESDPAAVAQELSNLQALRRMSMDVGQTSDPDLPSFQGVSLMPSVAPTGEDDEDDPSRLFWVPARVHPELAPMEFKTFLENRVSSIKRRSGDGASLSPDGVERSGSGGSLRRKKSMLSRQINNDGGRGAVGYKDGAEQLERKKSQSGRGTPELKIADLQELDALVRDPSSAMQKLALDAGGRQDGDGPEEDMPLLPQAPGIGLRRSTRTTYRRGSLRKEQRVPFSKRNGSTRADTDGEDSPVSSPVDGRPAIGYPLTKVQSEPAPENFSRPNRGVRRVQNLHDIVPLSSGSESMLDEVLGRKEVQGSSNSEPITPLPNSGSGSQSRNTTMPRVDTPVPRIIETPPQPEEEEPVRATGSNSTHQFPERSSSQKPPQAQPKQSTPEPPARSIKRPGIDRQNSSNIQTNQRASPSQTLTDMAQHPSPLPGSSARTDTLTFIPTLDEKKSDKKAKKDKDDSEGPRKTSWGWFKGSDEKEKKEKKKDEDKKTKAKAGQDKSHDTARLDVLQSTMDPSSIRGRESLLLDRDSMDYKLQDERKKESSRKSSDGKKEKDGLFSSFFGGGKKKADRDSGGKKGSSLRTLSPDPPHRQLRPDVDYNWTRFSILEERAIYRMAHIKLANPRRALYSQVLLSNFMYSYLAKVQQMHPQMQVPQSALQKKQEAERQQKEQEQQYREEQEQQQGQSGGDNYRYDYHQGITQYAEPASSSKPEGANYVDDSQIYDYDHPEEDPSRGHTSDRPESRASQHNPEGTYGDQTQYDHQRDGKDYYQYSRADQQTHRSREEDDDEMW